jgi:hypothetical protein
MKYVISWFERPQGSPMEYENAQKRILEAAELADMPPRIFYPFDQTSQGMGREIL